MTIDSDDAARVRQLAELALLDAPVDPLIAQVCELAAAFFGVPFAFVSLLDATRTHLFAQFGIPPMSMARSDSFCDVTVKAREALIVADTARDPRFSENVFVVGDPHLRFYAGVPLAVGATVPLGAFCIADRKPRDLDAHKVEALRLLAQMVVNQIAHHAGRQVLARQAIAMADQQAILAQTERFAKVGGFELDPRTGAMSWTQGLNRLYGLDGSTVPTRETFADPFDLTARRQIGTGFAKLAEDGTDFDLEAGFAATSGLRRHVHVHAEWRRIDPASPKIVGIVQDITNGKAAVAQLEWIAAHDGLTRLCNRQAFHEALDRAIDEAARFDRGVALITLDIDRFKTINDMHGHDAGDEALVAVAERLTEAVAGRGLVARIGGDEFAVLLVRFDAEGTVAAIATRILFALRKPFLFKTLELSTRATLGVAIARDETRSANELFKNADIALYSAKQAGRDGFAFYRTAMRDELENRLGRLAIAKAAIFDGRFEPYYQPKICLRTGEISGFEALLRWRHPTKGLCAPAEMGDAFADTELAVAIGRGMIDRVLADMVSWRASGVAFHSIALNVAEPEFYADDYAEHLLSRLRAEDLAPGLIEVEVTESVFLGHGSNVVARTMQKLATAGIAISLDDFGTGFASLTHLKQHPVSAIKIDRSFVTDIETDPHAATIVDAVTSLANSLKIAVVAEGIETPFQAEFLRARECTIGQGYFFAKPMAASRVPHFVRTWAAKVVPRTVVRA